MLLGLLAEQPTHGYALKQRYGHRFPQARPLAYGQVYTSLQRFVRDGLAEVEGTEADGGPERTSYYCTDRGKSLLAAWMGEVIKPAPFVSSEIFVKLTTMLAGSRWIEVDAVSYLEKQQAAHLARIRELKEIKGKSRDLMAALSLDYALDHLDADLRWMAKIVPKVGELAEEIKIQQTRS